MSDFASCYFCGDAVDADVRRYPVVPDDADAPTVDLCPACHRKLTTVLETVLTSLTDDSVVVEAVESTATASVDDTIAVEADTDLLHDIDEPGAGGGTADGPDSPDEAAQEAAEGAESGDGTAEESDDGGDEEVAEASEGDTAAEDSEPDEPVTDVEDESSAIEDDGIAAAGASAGDGDTADAETSRGESTRGRDDGASSETASLLTTPAAKKVVRLLQNRAFPVDREEFEVVASNAYDIPMDDCEDVVDALVAEGYVAADGDQLVRPEE